MLWLKNVLVDVAVTVLIVLAATLDLAWARWIVLIYTPFMLIMKIVFFLGSRSLGALKPKSDGVPAWLYHVLYGVNVAVTAGAAALSTGAGTRHWWMLAGGWALIWILSIATEARLRPAPAR